MKWDTTYFTLFRFCLRRVRSDIPCTQDCTPCSSGHYCETTGLLAPTGPCHGGYYCKRGVEEAAPTSGMYTVGLLEYGGDLCPAGTFCPNGTHTPLVCDSGTYNDLVGKEECFPCPPGFYCGAYATEYESSLCPAGWVLLYKVLFGKLSSSHRCGNTLSSYNRSFSSSGYSRRKQRE